MLWGGVCYVMLRSVRFVLADEVHSSVILLFSYVDLVYNSLLIGKHIVPFHSTDYGVLGLVGLYLEDSLLLLPSKY